MLDAIAQYFTDLWTGEDQTTTWLLLWSGIIIIVVLFIRQIAIWTVNKNIDDVKRAFFARRIINYIAAFFILILLGRMWFLDLQDIGTFLGLVAAGLVLAFRDPLINMAGWIFILLRRPYSVGDRIEVNGQIGDVIDIRMFQTYLMECGHWVDADQSTGRIVLVPNGSIFSAALANFTYGFEHIWDEISIPVTFESDWRRAKNILEDIAEKHASPLCEGAAQQIRKAASEHLIFFQKLTPIVYTAIKPHGVVFSLRYLTPPRQRRGNQQRIFEAVLNAFSQEPSIQFAYPTTRFFQHAEEGKPALRPVATTPTPNPTSPGTSPASTPGTTP